MFSSFFKITLRNLYREKMYASINIAGLSLAVACFLMLGLYLRGELTYDRHNSKYRQIFRVEQEITINGKTTRSALTSRVLAPMLMEQYPGIMKYVRFMVLKDARALLTHEDKSFYWDNVCFTNYELFDVFDHEIIYGEKPKTNRFTAVSETLARTYFGDENPIGKNLSSEGKTVPITLVFKDMPQNTHLKYDLIFADYFFGEQENNSLRRQMLWTIPGDQGSAQAVQTYLLMPEGYDPKDFKAVSEAFYERNMAEYGKANNMSWHAWLQPLADIHLNSNVSNDLPTGNKFYLYGFAAVAIFILLVACINYMNLATARAAKRAKEVGMRKILGSGRNRLMLQFLCEAVVFSLIAMFLGLVLVEAALYLTPISSLLGKHLVLNLAGEPQILVWLFGFSLVIGLLSGIYPALYLSSIIPLSALVSSVKAGKGSIRLKQTLVLVQFIISVTVIACTLLMALQMRYISNKALGFNKENRLLVTLRTADVIDKVPTLKNEILKNSNILGAALCSNVVGKNYRSEKVEIENKEGVPEQINLNHLWVGNDFLDVMGMELVSGRDFSKRLITDYGHSFVVNEATVQKMGWKEPIGKHIGQGRVIGVVKDFHYDSFHKPIEPFALERFPGTKDANPMDRRDMFQYLVLNVSGNEIYGTLNFLEDKFSEFDPAHPFEFEFLDDSLNKLYMSEQKLMKLIGIFAVVCIFISCMGLFGLAALTTEQRTKEIGVRKVLGSTTWQIIVLLSKNILMLVTGGSIIASLIAYYVMDEWLTDFVYKTGIDLWVFIVSAAIAAFVGFITIALQSYKTAQADPVYALRYE